MNKMHDAPVPDPGVGLTVSVIICGYTLDRWVDILAAVESIVSQRRRADEVIVVVDHNPDLYLSLRSALPTVTVIENSHARGLSGARNAGIESASTDLVAFLDDDAIAHPDWLSFLCDAYTDERVAGVGGTTVPRWDTARPAWMPWEFDWVLGCTFTGREPGEVRNLLGGNASFRRGVFDAIGGFPEQIGRTSAHERPLGCEETELCIRARQKRPDWTFLFEPRAVIEHRVTPERAGFTYFRSRCFAEGLSKAAVVRSVGAADGLAVERRYVAKTLVRGMGRGLAEALKGNSEGLGRSFAIAVGLLATSAGYARGGISPAQRDMEGTPR